MTLRQMFHDDWKCNYVKLKVLEVGTAQKGVPLQSHTFVYNRWITNKAGKVCINYKVKRIGVKCLRHQTFLLTSGV